jgi:lysophospholipase L1-like esterase
MRKIIGSTVLALVLAGAGAYAGQPAGLGDNLRYLSLGDSFAAGKGAIPVTQGYAYLLYHEGTFASLTGTTFANAAVGGTTSSDVLAYQVPQVIRFKPHVVTIYAGLNDLQKLFGGADPNTVLQQLGSNMTQIMCGIKATMQSQGIDPLVIVGNLPDMPWLSEARPEVRVVIMLANQIIAAAANGCGARVADVFNAFEGRKELFLQYRQGADPNEPHPNNVGYRVMAKAFKDAAR